MVQIQFFSDLRNNKVLLIIEGIWKWIKVAVGIFSSVKNAGYKIVTGNLLLILIDKAARFVLSIMSSRSLKIFY